MEQVEKVEQVYQVFINHRGPDTKNNLARPIYERLTSYGLRVFLDRDELCTGNAVYDAIERAIDSASVHIALFSQSYAESRPCLDELCRMMNRRADCKFIPVFFDVEPRHLSGIDRPPYADAFAKHQRKIDEGKLTVEVVDGWKKALREAAVISGLVFKTGESQLWELIENIVKLVLKAVKWDLLEVARYPVGLDEAAEDFQNKIMKPSELNAPKIVLIAGMGGLGKSTLAKHLYNVRRSDFTHSCFLSGVRKKDDQHLWQQLVLDLLGRDVPCNRMGKSNLRAGLKGKRILVVFDDVEDKGKITSLLDMDAVEPGSLILITSRHKDIPRALKSILYDVKPLKRKHARELFCRHAFDKSKPPEEYETLVEEFLKFCGGLPLCLEVLGEKLGENLDRKDWMQQLNNCFNQGQPLTEAESVINRLMWSYEALKTDEEKGIFLDIGCFLVGEAKELAIRVLEGLGWVNVAVRLNDLRQKCFLEFCSDVQSEVALLDISKGCHKIIMHEQVRELARHIARKDKDKPLRISCSYDIDQILQLQPALSPCLIRGIRIPQDHQPPKSIPQDHQLPKSMINILGLRLFVVEHHIDFSWIWGPGGQTWNLVWLRLCHCSLSSIALTISLRNLRVLELQGSDSDITYPWQRVTMEGYPGQLQELNIQFPSETSLESMTRMVGIIGQSTNLNKIEFKNITNMQYFPIDPVSGTNLHFSMPTNLTHLDLSGCTNLIQLPNSFSKCLCLQYLALIDCENLSIPTDILGEISTLEYVDFSGCVQLKLLPNGMAYQKSLRCLDLRRTSLLQLPDNLKLLVKLEELVKVLKDTANISFIQ